MDDADRIADLDRRVGELEGTVKALKEALLIRTDARRIFDRDQQPSGIYPSQGEWERACALLICEHLLQSRPAAVNAPSAAGYEQVVFALADAISHPGDL